MSDDDRLRGTGVLLPTALLALLLSLLFGTPQRAQVAREDGLASTPPSSSIRSASRLLEEHLNRPWQGPRDAALAGLDFIVATFPDPVASRLDYTFDRYVDALQRGIEVAGYRLDRFDLPWTRAREAGTGGGTDEAAALRVADRESRPGVLLFTKRSAAGDQVAALIVYLVGETPTTGVDQAALVRAFEEIAALCWSHGDDVPAGGTCTSKEIDLLAPSFSGSRRSLEIALGDWSRSASAPPDVTFNLVSGSVTGISTLSGITDRTNANGVPLGRLRSTALPDSAFVSGIVEYITHALGESCERIAFLTESSGFGQNLRSALAHLEKDGRPCRVLSLTFPMHLAELRREAERIRAGQSREPAAPAVPAQDIPIGTGARTDRSVVAQVSTDEAASSELVLRNLLSTIAREEVRYVGLISTDVRDRLFLAGEVSRHAPDTTLFVYGADVLYLHSDYNLALRGALVVTPYPLLTANQLWTAPYDGAERRMAFPVSTAQGVYNAALALLGCESRMLEYHRPFFPNQASRRPALWLTAVGKSRFLPVSILTLDEAAVLNESVYWTSELAQSSCPGDAPKAAVTTLAASLPALSAERGLSPELAATLMFALTILAFGMALAAVLICGYHVHHAFDIAPDGRTGFAARGLRRLREASGSWMETAVQSLWLSRDGRFDRLRWRCALVAVTTITMLYLLSVALYWLPVTAFEALELPAVGVAPRAAALGVLLLLIVATGMLALHPFVLRFVERRSGQAGALDPEDRVWSHVPSIALAAAGLAVAGLLVRQWRSLGDTPQLEGEAQLLLYARATDIGGGLSPMLPLLLAAATAVLWAISEWRRLHLIDDLSGLRRTGEGPERAIPFLDVARSSLGSLAEIETRIRRSMADRLTALPRVVTLPVLLVTAFAMWRIYGQAPWSIDGRAFDRLWWAAFAAAYFVLIASFVRAACAMADLLRLLRHLMHHPIRASFARLQTLYGRSLRVDPAHARGTTSLLALTIEHAERTLAELPPNATGRLALTRHIDAAASTLRSALVDEANGRWAAAGERRRLAHAHMSEAAEIIVGLLDRGPWQTRVPRRTVLQASVGAGDAALPAPADAAAGHDSEERPEWVRQAELTIACRITDFVNHVIAVLRHLSLFVTFGLILMMLASASYPFQPRELLLAWNWSVVGTVVLASLVAIVQLGRDPILLSLAGTQQSSLLNRDVLMRVFVYGALPILSLLGVQFPEIVNRVMPWLASLAGH